MEEAKRVVQVTYSDKLLFTLNWHDDSYMSLSVIKAARCAVETTVRQIGSRAAFESGALEHHVKVPELGLVFIVVSSNGSGKFVAHCTRSRKRMMEIFDCVRSSF